MLALGLIQASVHVGQKVHIYVTGLKRFMVHIKAMVHIGKMVHIKMTGLIRHMVHIKAMVHT